MKQNRYSFEFKKKVVMAYLNGEGSMQLLADRFGIKGSIQVSRWVMHYNKYGDAGLSKVRPKTYSFDYKLHIVELYLTSNLSYNDIGLAEGIKESSIISEWVQLFRRYGVDGLKKKEVNKLMKSPENNDHKPSEADKDERIKELEDKLLKLEIENAYLKELRRLRQEKQQKKLPNK